MLVIIYINDLLVNLSYITKIYADKTKILGRIRKDFYKQDTLLMQEDIEKVYDCTNTWLMRFNIEKYKIIYFGKKKIYKNNTMSNYNDNGRISLLKLISNQTLKY